MAARPSTTNAAPLFAAVAVTYGANCTLGTAVAARLIDTRSFRWLHHALYIATCTLGAAAVGVAWWGRPRGASRRAALALLPAAAPLTAIAFVNPRTRRHPLIALAAAPFVVAGVVCSRHPANRK